MPQTRVRCLSERAIEEMRIDEVLEAMIVSGETTASSSPNSFCLTSRFSNTASTTTWQSFNAPSESATARLASVLARSASVSRPLATRPFRTSRIAPFALAAPPAAASYIRALMPPWAVTCAMPRPMAPVPTTPTTRSGRLTSNVIRVFLLSALRHAGTHQAALDVVEGAGIVDRRRHLPRLAVGDLLHGAAQDLARARLGQPRHDQRLLEESDGADAVAHHLDHFAGDLLRRPVDARLQHKEAERHLALELVGDAHARAFGDVVVARQHFLDLAGAEAMTGHVDHVVDPRHHRDIAVLVDEARVARLVVAREVGEVDLPEALVGIP